MSMPVIDGAVRNLKKVNEHIDEGMEDILTVMTSQDQDMFDADNVSALEKVMLDYASMERTLKQFTKAVNQVKTQLNNESGADFFDVSEVLDATFEEIQSGNTDKELLNHIRVQEFQNRLQELQAESEELDEEAGTSSAADQSLGEEELVMTQAEVGTRCPFTQREMTNPVRNTICGHHYDHASISELLKKKKKIGCPLTGCANPKPIQEDHLEADTEFKRQVDKQRKLNRRRQADTLTQ